MAKLYFYYSAMNAGKTTTLLQSAQALMNSIDGGTELYQNIAAAISNLQGVIDGPSPTSADVAAAMSRLTQAMAAAY